MFLVLHVDKKNFLLKLKRYCMLKRTSLKVLKPYFQKGVQINNYGKRNYSQPNPSIIHIYLPFKYWQPNNHFLVCSIYNFDYAS